MLPQPDVFTRDEIARAAGVPRAVVQRLIDAGDALPVDRTEFFDLRASVYLGRKARLEAASTVSPSQPDAPSAVGEPHGLPAAISSALHAALLAGLIWSTSGIAEMATSSAPTTRLVFLAGPGPGGGGGGGGRTQRADVRRIQRPRPKAAQTLAPQPEPLPSRALVSPVAMTAGEDDPAALEEEGAGPGAGPGLDDGTGGGAGGGPFRPGSGIDPPRLLREVKAQYTEEARRRGVTGAVVLEIVIRQDGTVGDVTVLRGLGAGLDERAVSAVREWRFAPARRLGAPVDVIVEVEVEFSLR